MNENIMKNAICLGDGYTEGSLLRYLYIKGNSKTISTDLSKQEAINGNPKATQQISFTENLYHAEGAWMVFILEEVEKIVFRFST